MVKCICIDDKKKPKEIPVNKWVKEGNEYHVIFTVTCLPQKVLGFHLAEIELTDECLPYEYFLGIRFAFNAKDIPALIELIKNCTDLTDFDINELIEETELQEQ